MNHFDGDTITLTGIRVHANHGVFDFERRDGQLFVIDVTLALDLSRSSQSDELHHTVNYAEVAEEIAEAVRRDAVDLIETVAERVAKLLLSRVGVTAVRVTVHKPEAPIATPVDDVAVTVVRLKPEAEL